jgi:hypothetical protein
MTRWLTRMVAIAAAGFVTVGSAKADIVIDDFNRPIPGQGFAVPAGASSAFVNDATSVLYTNRRVEGFMVSPNPAINGPGGPPTFLTDFSAAVGSTTGGTLRVDIGTDIFAYAEVTYTGNWNFAGLSQMNLSFLFADQQMPIGVLVTGSGGTASFAGAIPPPTPVANYNFIAPLASFVPTGTFNFNTSSINTIKFIFNTGGATPAADFSLDQITVSTPVPAPPALLLVGAAVPVLGIRRWMTNRKAVASVA